MDQDKQYNIQIKAAEKYAVTEVEQRLQYYETQLSPHINKLENIKRNLGKPQTLNERQIGNLQMAGDSPIVWYKQAYSQANQRAEASVQAFYDLQKSALKIRKLENKTDRSELDDIKLAELKTQYIISQGYVENSITELNQYMATAQRIKEAFDIQMNCQMKSSIVHQLKIISNKDLSKLCKISHNRVVLRKELSDI